MGHWKDVHQTVQRVKLEAIEKEEGRQDGRLSAELFVGDAVLVRREPTAVRAGPTRFQERVYEGVFVIKRKVSEGTYYVEYLADKAAPVPFIQPLASERLVKLDMPELELSADQPRRLEMREGPADAWTEYVIDRFGADGRVRLVLEGGGAQTRRWVDRTKCGYRWLA